MKNICLFISIISILSGCAESKVTTLWKAKDIDFLNCRTVVVLGPTTGSDTTLRNYMENHLVGDLNDLGYIAISAREKFGSEEFANMNVKRIIQLLKKNNDVDALITIVLLKKETGIMFVPGAFYSTLSSLYSDSYYDFNEGSRDVRYDPGYYLNYADYFWICSVYDIGSGKLAYSVQSYSTNVVNTQIMAHEYGQSMVKNMQKQKIIRKKNKMKPF